MSIEPKERKETEPESVIWNREEPGARRAAYSRDAIAEAALKVADTEGFDALSMRRVAQELGAGTMTLYHYVRNKEELITLMSDRAMGEILVPDDQLSPDWRGAITQVAHRTRGVFLNHPWAIERMNGGGGGPNGMRHFEQSLKAVEGTGASSIDRLDIVSMVDDYVFGFALREIAMMGRAGEGPGKRGPASWSEPMAKYFEEQIATGKFPQIESLRGEGSREEQLNRIADTIFTSDRFDRGLSRLLDGIEGSLDGGNRDDGGS